jgi:pimeloyl-ACP methyl ester carboxylesterase
MSELAEDVSFEAIKGSGHWMPEEAPESFVDVISRWLVRVLWTAG